MEFSKKNVTYIIIFIFILLSLTHLVNIKDNTNDNDNDNDTSNVKENFITLTEDQIFAPGADAIIPSTDLVQFGELGTSKATNNLSQIINNITTNNIENATKISTLTKTIVNLSSNINVLESTVTTLKTSKNLELDGNNMFIVPGTLRASKINVGIGGSPLRNTINCPEPMFISTTGTLTLESSSNVNVTGNLNFINTNNTINVKDWGNIKGGRVHLHSTVDDTYLVSKRNTVILKSAGWDSSGNLIVEGASTFSGQVTVNTRNKHADDINRWWKNNGTGQFIVRCDTIEPNLGCLKIETADWGKDSPTFSTLNSKGRLHLYSDEQIYVMAKNVMIHKSDGIGATGNLIIDGELNAKGGKIQIGPDFSIVGQGSSCILNTGVRHIDFLGDAHFNIYNKNGLALRKGTGGTGNLAVEGSTFLGGTVSIDGLPELGGPIATTRITAQGIIFGGANNGREWNSAQISAGKHVQNSLNIVGMSTGVDAQTRKIDMWAEGGLTVRGGISTNGTLMFTKKQADGGNYIDGGEWVNLKANRVHLQSTVDNIYLMPKGSVIILKNDFWQGSGNLLVEGTSTFGGPVTIISKYKNCDEKNRWHSNDGTGSFIVGCDSVPVSSGCLKIDTADWKGPCGDGPVPTFSSIHCKGRLHILASYDLILISPNTIINKDPGIGGSGNLVVQGTLTVNGANVTSDRRLKENIATISENDKDKVLQLVPKTYNMIDDEKKSKRYGLIAQEVEELYPELVSEDDKGMKSLNYIELIPLLLEQIKELKKTIPNQETINIDGAILTKSDILKLKQLIM